MRKEDVVEKWKQLDTYNIEQACNYIRKMEQDVREYLAQFVAAICNVDVESMLAKTDVIYLANARWLYWYAYRYMTNESYEKIAADTSRNGHKYKLRSVQGGVNKMADLIDKQPLWERRWHAVKKFIKLRDTQVDEHIDNTIVIQVPRDVKDKIKIVIKEK